MIVAAIGASSTMANAPTSPSGLSSSPPMNSSAYPIQVIAPPIAAATVWIRMSRLRMWASSWAITPRSSRLAEELRDALRHGHRSVLGVAARREGVRLACGDHVEPRHRDAGRVGQLAHHLVQPRCLLLRERLCPAHSQGDLVREEVGDEVQRETDEQKQQRRGGAADQATEHHEDAGQGGKNRPVFAPARQFDLVTSFMCKSSCPRAFVPIVAAAMPPESIDQKPGFGYRVATPSGARDDPRCDRPSVGGLGFVKA